MAAQWEILNIEHALDDNGDPEFITVIHWEVTDANGEHIGRSYGSIGIPEGHAARSVPYANINENQVIAWVKADLGDEVGEIESAIAGQVAEKVNPTKGRGLPWL